MTGNVFFYGEELILDLFWATQEPCLWIRNREQLSLPKVEFVGGHPDEYCIFIKNLSKKELKNIKNRYGFPINIEKEVKKMKEEKKKKG